MPSRTLGSVLRIRRGCLAALVAIAWFGAGCGANVVFGEGGGSSSGGAPGEGAQNPGAGGHPSAGQGGFTSQTATNGTTTSSSTVTVSCQTDECMIGQVVCECDGSCTICDGDGCELLTTSARCQWEDGAGQCECLLGRTVVGKCTQADLDCDATTNCCAAIITRAAGG